MVLMLPMPADNGARLAAVLPTALASLAMGLGKDPTEVLSRALENRAENFSSAEPLLSGVTSVVLIVVDGLGFSNLRSAAGHARTLKSLQTRRIETVIPSTTGAALTSITTGRLPGVHGLVGYKIRHPKLGLVTTLKGWDGITNDDQWQRATPLFGLAEPLGAGAAVIGRPAHANGGLTRAILSGAQYHGGQTIDDRFSIASRLLRANDPHVIYLYVDELDKIAHAEGWKSGAWLQRLEQFDAALQAFLQSLPGGVGVVITADHGIVDVPEDRRVVLDAGGITLDGVAEIGGEPRMRSLYVDGADPQQVVERLRHDLGRSAWVGTREEAIKAQWFGANVDRAVADRLGDVLVTARGEYAFVLEADGPAALAMVGQHGGLSDEERGVPLILAGAFAGTSFAGALTKVALTYG
jgi:predicted AlkP superfamily pyrophosphatase or phosphodiesterase